MSRKNNATKPVAKAPTPVPDVMKVTTDAVEKETATTPEQSPQKPVETVDGMTKVELPGPVDPAPPIVADGATPPTLTEKSAEPDATPAAASEGPSTEPTPAAGGEAPSVPPQDFTAMQPLVPPSTVIAPIDGPLTPTEPGAIVDLTPGTHLETDGRDIVTIPGDPSVDRVISELSTMREPATGYLQTRPDAVLSGEEADTQAKIFAILSARGMVIHNQSDVYGWLLRQIRSAAFSD